MKVGMTLAASALCGAAIALAGCGGAAAKSPPKAHPVSAAQAAIKRGIAAECKPAQNIDDGMNSASTVADFDSGVSVWESDLTAASNIPLTGVPIGNNAAREIAVDYAKANLVLNVAQEYDDPFGSGFSLKKLKRDYNMALSAVQDVLNTCAENGDY
jgi:hypothetical protein